MQYLPALTSEFAINTREIRSQMSELPNSYKADLAMASMKLAIELDGRSHRTAESEKRDRKKELALGLLGWAVIRFSNQDVLSDTEAVVKRIQDIVGNLNPKLRERLEAEAAPTVYGDEEEKEPAD